MKRENIKGLMKKIGILLQIGLVLAMLTLSVGAAQDYKQTNLVSDTSGLAKFTDKNLVNPWGLARSSTSPWWISDNGMGVSTLYNGSGDPFPIGSPLIVTIPPDGSSPTGVVFNEGTGFEVNPGEPARFIFVSEDGRVTAWNSSSNQTNAIVKANTSTVYKGVTIANNGGQDYLYVANFRNGTVDTFDSNFNETSLGDKFKDVNIPDGFAPFNIVNINGDLFVTFAKQDAAKHDDVAGAGLGFVDKFSPNGTLLMRLENGSWLNSPWGVALAPNNFGELSNNLLVGNFGSGQIATFDPENGSFNGFVQTNGSNINISGLWALVFGNDATAGPSNVLFFTAGIEGEQHGLFGSISQNVTVAPPPPSGKIWKVDAGGQTSDMAIQGMAFYPGIITVNVGDTVKWNIAANFHTISFLSGQAPPPDGSPESLSPHGGSGYNGTGLVSSGILPTGGNYSLTFTEPGIFTYRCLIHPGMQGIVIVQPNGSKYPFTQRGYRNQGQKDLVKDKNIGKKLTSQVAHMIKSSPGLNGTTNWKTFIDIPLSEKINVPLKQMNNSNVKGRAILNMASAADLNVQINVSGLEPNSEHLANIKIGTCNTPGSTVFTVGNFAADSNGDASLVADVNVSPPFGIMNRGWIVDVDKNTSNAESIACGNVVKHDAARMRFARQTLTIHQGDTVSWTQLGPMEIHTVSFLAANQTSPALLLPGFVINPDVAGPSGIGVYNGTGFFNSGILIPGASYSLTFSEPGTFKYECLIHDEMKMIGYIKVRPKGS